MVWSTHIAGWVPSNLRCILAVIRRYMGKYILRRGYIHALSVCWGCRLRSFRCIHTLCIFLAHETMYWGYSKANTGEAIVMNLGEQENNTSWVTWELFKYHIHFTCQVKINVTNRYCCPTSRTTCEGTPAAHMNQSAEH